MKKLLSLALVGTLALPSMLAAQAPRRPGLPGPQGPRGPLSRAQGEAVTQWTGYVTDTHCGVKGATKDHSVACVEKCMKGGSKPQIFNEADQKLYNLDSFDKVKGLMGSKITVDGVLDSTTAPPTIQVQSARKAEGE